METFIEDDDEKTVTLNMIIHATREHIENSKKPERGPDR